MTERIKRLQARLKVDQYPLCTEKVRIMIPSFEKHAGFPVIVQRAQAVADYLDNRTIFIEPDELIIGNIASRPMGMELKFFGPVWQKEDWDDLMQSGLFTISDEDKAFFPHIDDYWLDRGRNMQEQQGFYYDDDNLWPKIQRGFLTPAWKSKTKGRGYGAAGCGWGFSPGPTSLLTPDYAKFLGEGIDVQIERLKEARKNLRFDAPDSCDRADFYHAALTVLPAMVRIAKRYSKLALEMAEKETDPKRKQELLTIAETCDRVPAKPARTFREAIQAFFFFWVYLATGTTPGGRFDQFMYPYYKADLEAGRITREEALELIECLRIKIMQFNYIGGGKNQREKWAGMSRWHNFIIGGTDSEGKDITNDVTYMLLDAVDEVRTPHFTLSLRVHENTPPELMQRCVELVSTGIGMPAFISEKSYMNAVMSAGVPEKDARDFTIAGCLDVQIPGRSRQNAIGMFLMPTIVELAMNNGRNPKNGTFYGVESGEFTSFKTYEEFYQAFLKQLRMGMSFVNEEHNILLTVLRRNYPDAFVSVFQENGIEIGRDVLNRPFKFENASVCNCVGMANTVDSLAAVKKLVFEDKTVSAQELVDALNANWEGHEQTRRLCLDAPKYGNDDDYADEIAVRLWDDYADICKTLNTVYNSPILPSGISITAHAPGGAITGPTPDGRRDGDTFADGSVSPVQGRDTNGPLAVLQSGMKLHQDRFMSTLLNMKISPNSLKSAEDKAKLGNMIKTFLTNGGKHIQFNVVDKSTLIAAREDKATYRDLIVRVAGYSAYYVGLTTRVQDEIIARTEHTI